MPGYNLAQGLEHGVVRWLSQDVLVSSNLIQLATILATFLLARWLGARLAVRVAIALEQRETGGRQWRLLQQLATLTVPLTWLALQWLASAVADQAGWPRHLLTIAVSLLSAWVVIRFSSGLIRDESVARLIAYAAWALAALSTLNLLHPAMALLNGIGITLGSTRLSALSLLKGAVALVVLLWGALALSALAERRLAVVGALTPSARVLLAKLAKVLLVTLAVVVGLDTVGIDLTAIAVFSGALGVGLGFGLQKIVANLVSGVILLLDKSVKPGDFIAVGSTYGWIQTLGARYVSVVTRDGTEHLVPNEDLITARVENWSHSSNEVRLRIPVGVAYGTDVRLAMRLCLEAAAAVPRVLAQPRPACLLKSFGDSSLDLELRIWINDPRKGKSNVKSDVLLGVLERFVAHGVEIPFPQRDLHLRTMPPGAAPAAGQPVDPE